MPEQKIKKILDQRRQELKQQSIRPNSEQLCASEADNPTRAMPTFAEWLHERDRNKPA